MTDSQSSKLVDNAESNRRGRNTTPEIVWDAFTIIFALAIPIIVMRNLVLSPFPSLVLQHLVIFRVLVSRNVLSVDQLASVEFLFVLLVVSRLAGFPAFFRKCVSKYSQQNRAPDSWKIAWHRQIRLAPKVFVIFWGVVIISGEAIQYGILPASFLTPKQTFLIILILSLGLWFLIDGIFVAVVYWFLYRRFWKNQA